MENRIFVNSGTVKGCINAFPSKSYLQRAIVLGLLNRNGILIENYAECGDSSAVLNSVLELGAEIKLSESSLRITGPEKFRGGEIFCGESGLCLRLFTPVLSLSDREFVIKGSQNLLGRDNFYIPPLLEKFGSVCTLGNDYLRVKGPLKSARVSIAGIPGSQLISGLLFALSLTRGDSLIEMSGQASAPYIKMTAALLNSFGAGITYLRPDRILIKGDTELEGGQIKIEGDWSSAAFFLVAGAIAGDVSVSGLDMKSLQPDREIVSYLDRAGASVSTENDICRAARTELRPFEADIKDHPDLFIPLVILALNCEGETRIYNWQRLKSKESDRPAAIMKELGKAGADISVREDCISVSKSILTHTETGTYNDHRMAMGLAVAALSSDKGLTINDPLCVNKSFPGFFSRFKSLMSGENNEHFRKKF